jgi:hypothetical protein
MAVGKPFPKGVSPNPGGRPKAHPEVRALIAAKLPTAVEKLGNMLDSADKDDVRFAVKALLEWGLAKPAPEGMGGVADALNAYIEAMKKKKG